MNPTCGCCEGTRQLTPADSGNRPGLDAILYRAGTHSTFLETMKARLSNWVLDPPAGHTSPGKRGSSPLLGLSTRDDTDFAIALLDAWAMVADVLTFYQDRIANEGYLRTATERLSIVELARLIGYEPRPGVAASVYLAYTIDSDKSKPKPAPTFTDIPAGSRAQSIPGPGELPQSFETSAPLKASDIWNNLRVRQTQPQAILPTDKALYFKGIATNLKPGDRLLLDFGKAQTPRQVLTVEPDADHNRTKVTLDVSLEQAGALPKLQGPETLGSKLIQLTESLTQTLQPHPSSSVQLQRDLKTAFSESSDLRPRLVAALHPEIAPQQLYTALENAPALPAPIADVYVFRTRASPFGANSPKKQVFGFNNQIKDPVEWPLTTVVSIALDSFTMLVSVINATQSESSIPRGWSVDTRIHLDRLPPPKEESPVPPSP